MVQRDQRFRLYSARWGRPRCFCTHKRRRARWPLGPARRAEGFLWSQSWSEVG